MNGYSGSRYGAGRPGWRRKCEHMLRFDVRRLSRDGLLSSGRSFSWSWSRDGEQTAAMSVSVRSELVELRYFVDTTGLRTPLRSMPNQSHAYSMQLRQR